eukprot:3566966-Amphidinium_carterae.1
MGLSQGQASIPQSSTCTLAGVDVHCDCGSHKGGQSSDLLHVDSQACGPSNIVQLYPSAQ